MCIFFYKFVLWLQRNMYVSAHVFLQKALYPGKKLIIKIRPMCYSKRLIFHSITTKSGNISLYIFITIFIYVARS